jgi:WD40 repeat protein
MPRVLIRSCVLGVLVFAGCSSDSMIPDSGSGGGNGRIVFLSRSPHAGVSATAAIISMNPDGSDVQQLGDSLLLAGPSTALSPDGSMLAVSSTSSGIHIVTLASGARRLIAANQLVGTITWKSDSKAVLYNDEITAKIGTASVETGTARIVLNGLYPTSGGGLVAYQVGGRGWFADSAFVNASRIDPSDLNDDVGPVSVSPDGRYLASEHTDRVVAPNIVGQLFVYDVQTATRRQLTFAARTDGNIIGAPIWSPNGSQIAYGSQGKLFAINFDGTGGRQVTPDSLAVPKAGAWSPHGSRIAFVSGGNVYVINSNGTGLTQLTSSANVESNVHWTP